MSENLSPIGFWSYARQDDEEKLTGLRSILQRQLQQKYGREPIKIFQDVAAIPPGADWNLKISEALNSSTFLIPIITPNFLESEWCNQEFFLFLERERAIAAEFPELAASRRIFPIFYIDITDVEAFNPDLLPELQKRQWINFRDLIYKEDTHESVRLRLDQIAESLVKILRLDQRAVRERRVIAASQSSAQQAASQKQAEEAAAAQKAAAEQQAREAEAQRLKEIAEIRQREAEAEAQRQAAADRLAREQAERMAQAEAARLAQQQAEAQRNLEAQRQQQQREQAERAAQAEAARQAAATAAFAPRTTTPPPPAFAPRPINGPDIYAPAPPRPQPDPPFWRTPIAVAGAVLASLCLIVVLIVVIYSSSHHDTQTTAPTTSAPASTLATDTTMDQAKSAQTSGNFGLAAQLFDLACTDGSGGQEACVDLGILLSTGKGVTADVPKARKLFQQACTAGDQNGCSQLKVLQAALAALNGQDDNAAAQKAAREAAARKALEQ